jgi:hypothetical protein
VVFRHFHVSNCRINLLRGITRIIAFIVEIVEFLRAAGEVDTLCHLTGSRACAN